MRQSIALFIVVALILSLITGCRATKQSAPPTLPVVPVQSTINTNKTHVESIDTAIITIPQQSAERTTLGKSSHLETDYAESDAVINPDGSLSHSLKNKLAQQAVPVKHSADTIYLDRVIEKPVPVEVPTPVERELTLWEQTRLTTWAWIMAALVVCVLWIIRKPLVALIRRLI